MSDRDAIEVAREALTRLAETRDSGFEGLLCEVLSAHLGASLRLCSSGRQYGRDMGNGEIAAEAKRYGDTRLGVRELAGEIAIAKHDTPSLALWVLGTTQSLAEQDFKPLDGVAEKSGVDLAVFDWSPASCPRLLTLIALQQTVAQIWFARHAPDAWTAVAEGIAMTRARGGIFRRTAEELELVASGLGLAERLRATLVRAVSTAVADPTGRLSRELFGQRIDLGSPEACTIERTGIDRDLDRAYERVGELGNSSIAIIGPEGVGKTWAVVAHALRRWPGRPLLFLSSLLIEEAERGDWGHQRLVSECVRRTVSVLDDSDPRFREEKFVDRLLSAIRSAHAGVFDPIIVLDGFNERQGGHWVSMVSSLPLQFGARAKAPIVVTTRPMPWAKLARDLHRMNVKVEQVEVGAFSEPEFEAACVARDIDAGAFDPVTAKDLRNPRLFRIAAGLLPQLAGAPVTRERVFLEYWRHRQEEATADGLEPEQFDDLLREHVSGAWGNLKLLKGERTLYFDARATQEAARFIGVEAAIRDVRDAVTSGFFVPAARSDRDESRFAADRLNYVLGLSLQRRLLEVTDEAVDDAENRARVGDRLGEDLEPMFDTDAAGVILATALLATCLQRIRNPAVSVGCLVHLLGQRNARGDEVAPTVRGMVGVAACADPLTFIAVVEELDDRDPWLVEALRIALAASDDRQVVAEALHRWLADDDGAPCPRRPRSRALPYRNSQTSRSLGPTGSRLLASPARRGEPEDSVHSADRSRRGRVGR